MILPLLFFASGATALVYEVIWSRYLTLLFGSTSQAQTVVLAIFMGGLALGNRLFGRQADTAQRPLVLYGSLEIAIGIYAFFFSPIYKVADGAFILVGSKLLGYSGWLLLYKGFLSAVLLLGPTILMGGTLPLIAAWLQKSTDDAGRLSARFYSINSLGAVFGAAMAGFFLVKRFGFPTTLRMTALCNVLIGCVAIGIAKRLALIAKASSPAGSGGVPLQTKPGVDPPVSTGATLTSPQHEIAESTSLRLGGLLVVLTGAVSMGLEILASRCLGLIFGASLQAFAIVLIAFILGIGFGSALIASPRRKATAPEQMTIVLVLMAAAWIGLLVINIETLAELYRQARSGLAGSAMGYRYYQVMAALFSILILGLPAAALGAVLPLWFRAATGSSPLLGDRVGRLLTWNTLGAVGGVLLTGFLLMPNLGLRSAFAALALLLTCAGLLVALSIRDNRATALASAGLALLLLVTFTGGETWRLVLSSGLFRLRESDPMRVSIRDQRRFDRLLFYQDAADATVSVEENGPSNARQLMLRINGKTDASSRSDLSTQYLLAHLPLMLKPDSKDVFVFGLGSGITAGAALAYPIEQVTIAENCPPVVRAARLFEPLNNGVLTNSHTRIWREDARTVLKLNSQAFDVIISEPSNPWTAGIGNVFSQEFYQLCARRLKPGGIMAQWFHLYEMNEQIVNLVMRTFGSVFTSMEVWDAQSGDVILLGSLQPWKSDRAAFEVALRPQNWDRAPPPPGVTKPPLPAPARQLAVLGLDSPEAILARQFASQRTAFAIAGPGPIQRDEFPILEYEAPKAFYMARRAKGLERFDERTWQSGLAPAEKNAILEGIAADTLKAIFGGEFKSMNLELVSCVEQAMGTISTRSLSNQVATHSADLLASPSQGDAVEPVPAIERWGGSFGVPCIFHGSRVRLKLPPAAVSSPMARQLFAAEVQLQSSPAEQARARDQIQQLLEAAPANPAEHSGWSASYYVELALFASLRLGDNQKAKDLLLRGLQLEPYSDVMHYLARVLIREGLVQPDEVARSQRGARNVFEQWGR